MDRRNVLTGIAAVPLAATIPFIPNKETMLFGYNLLGKRVEYTKNFVEDMLYTYRVDFTDVIKVMYGDYATFTRTYLPDMKVTKSLVTTNDSRDYWEWYQTRDGVIYNKVQTDPQRGFPFISIEEHKKMFPNKWKNIT